MVSTTETKTCTQCSDVKSVEVFGLTRRLADETRPLDSWCRACRAEAARNRRETPEGRDKARALSREYHASDKGKAWAKRWTQKPEVKAKLKAKQQAYNARPEVREARRKYMQSPERKAARLVYLRSEQGKAVSFRYCRDYQARKKGAEVGGVSHNDWLAILEAHAHTCVYCGADSSTAEITMDHVVPLSKGGQHSLDNIVPACRSCNAKKGNRIDWAPLQIMQAN